MTKEQGDFIYNTLHHGGLEIPDVLKILVIKLYMDFYKIDEQVVNDMLWYMTDEQLVRDDIKEILGFKKKPDES